MSKIVYFFRHGRTDWNAQHRFQGHEDIPLNEEGLEQAETLSDALVDFGIEVVLTSDLLRAAQTAERVCARLQVPLHRTPLLREACMGELQGKTYTEVIGEFGEDAMALWNKPMETKEDQDLKFPGGESRMELVERVLEAMEMALQRPESVVGLSTHGGAIRHTLGWLFPGIEETYLIPNISVYRVEHDGEKWSYGGRVFEGGNPHGTA